MATEQPKNDNESPVAPEVKREDSAAENDQDKNKIATQAETDLELADEFQATDN